jgi:predicted DCC family thiol-disulfide oxidoreductase YuxK
MGNSSIHGTVIYDGTCNLCHAFAEYSKHFDNGQELLFIPYQHCDLSSISPGLTTDMTSKSIFFIRSDGRRLSGARAIYESWKTLPGLMGVFGAIMSFSLISVMSEPLYRVVASRRHYLSRRFGLK